MASNMNASAQEFMPTLMSQDKASWGGVEEETWKEPWKEPWKSADQSQNWNDRKWNMPPERPEPHRYDEGEYMKGDGKGKGWAPTGKGKGKMTNGKGQGKDAWAPNNTTWKGSSRGMGVQYNGHNTQHNGHHSQSRRPEWNDWEEWDDWEEKGRNSEWSEAWRSQWRGAEPKPKWNQDRAAPVWAKPTMACMI